jgi:hypothetical protein
VKITNRSSFPAKRIEPLVDAILKHYRHPFMARLVLENREAFFVKGSGTGGHAVKYDRDPDRDQYAPSRVTLYLSRGLQYPRYSKYVLGPVLHQSWEEEVVFTLAHELRHIDQFWGLQESEITKENFEQDAEQYAINVMGAYRREQEKRWRSRWGVRGKKARRVLDTTSGPM